MQTRWFVLLLALAACGGGSSKPRYTSQQAMFEVDFADKDLAGALSDPPRALAAARKIREWMSYPAVVTYPLASSYTDDEEGYEAARQDFLTKLGALIQAAEAGDVGGIGKRYGPMRLSCEVCHARYRPALPGETTPAAGDG